MANEADDPRPDSEPEEEGGPIKPFLEHLEDLRWLLIRCLTALGVAMAVCMAAAPQVIEFLKWPLQNSGVKIRLEWLNPMGGMTAIMKISLWGGITLALPFLLYFIGSFIMPALKRREKKYFARAFIIGGGLFLVGVSFCYFLILGISLQGIVTFNSWLGIPTEIWRAEDYFQFVVMFMMGMGLSFEFPIILLTLVRLGVIPHEWLVKGRKYFFVVNLVIVCFITPDFISTFFIIGPVQLLFEICVLISKYWERQKRLTAAAEQAAETGAPREGATRHDHRS